MHKEKEVCKCGGGVSPPCECQSLINLEALKELYDTYGSAREIRLALLADVGLLFELSEMRPDGYLAVNIVRLFDPEPEAKNIKLTIKNNPNNERITII